MQMVNKYNLVYYGQLNCQYAGKKICKNKAYYKCENLYTCGVHSQSKTREILPKMTMKQQEISKNNEYFNEKKEIDEAAKLNREKGKRGKVILSKMKMMKSVENNPGYLKVFPNFKHQNRKDGFGCSSLSPMSLGPVNHGQPNLPPAQNIENFHQGSKCFSNEIDPFGNPTKVYLKSRLAFYNDTIPHRHKYKKDGKTFTRFFVWIDKDNKEHHLPVIPSRQFYCNFYQRLASMKEDFLTLKKKIKEGYNIQICGYDAKPIKPDEIEKAYLDSSSPFGHELVLFTMLTKEENEFPWLKYKTFEF
jgi:hypothetical protein